VERVLRDVENIGDADQLSAKRIGSWGSLTLAQASLKRLPVNLSTMATLYVETAR
jgi:hypothetical protein